MRALRLFIVLFLMTGVAYPLLITGIAQVLFPYQANGSLIKIGEKIVGSELIGQHVTKEGFFQGRPSAHNYDPMQSGGTNLGPTSKVLKEAVAERRTRWQGNAQEVPLELLFASGSGLDPHISHATALFQLEKVAKARSLEKSHLLQLIEEVTVLPFLGPPVVNVLQLNLSMEKAGVTSQSLTQ